MPDTGEGTEQERARAARASPSAHGTCNVQHVTQPLPPVACSLGGPGLALGHSGSNQPTNQPPPPARPSELPLGLQGGGVPSIRGPSWGSISAPGARRASFSLPFPARACFCPPSPNNLEYLVAVSKNPAHPLHPIYDDGKGGGWKWWEGHFVLLNSHFSAYATCFARKACGVVRSTWGISLSEDRLGVEVGYRIQR